MYADQRLETLIGLDGPIISQSDNRQSQGKRFLMMMMGSASFLESLVALIPDRMIPIVRLSVRFVNFHAILALFESTLR